MFPNKIQSTKAINARHQGQNEQIAPLDNKSYRDDITGVYTIDKMQQTLQKKMTEPQSTFSVICLNIDLFTEMNETYGCQVGNAVLKESARRLVTVTKNEQCVFRKYADEFMLLIDRPAHVNGLMTSLHRVFLTPFCIDGQSIRLSLSIGVAHYPNQGLTEEMLMYVAHVAMCRNKQMKLTDKNTDGLPQI
ncbi:GGDEF domain-containing protein [Lysinibacillus sp. KU-BSD001]|uniref:GGDEF domain-containing protein n=1 Tax=Lysinibacillus sp. KU-BSD001 TaxID=3141328 RepID=UPI0036EB6539